MTEQNIERISLAEILEMKDKGELYHDPNAPEDESMSAYFWAKAEVESPKKARSVHLKLDPDVFDFFYSTANGKGHLTKMQAVLKAYMKAHNSPQV